MADPIKYDGKLTCALGVTDRKASAAWYVDVLGFTLLYDSEEIGWCEMQSPVENVCVGFSEVETLDVMRAALELMAVAGPGEGSSKAWLSPAPQRPAFSYTTHALLPGRAGRRVLASVRDSEWKLIAYPDADLFELYNLREDPAETVNLFDERRDIYEALAEQLAGYRDGTATVVSP